MLSLLFLELPLFGQYRFVFSGEGYMMIFDDIISSKKKPACYSYMYLLVVSCKI